MKLTSSYAVEIKHINKLFRDTIKIYNDAISFCVKAFEEHWEVLETLETGNKERKTYADALIHSTKSNIAEYPEFDIKFHKMPSYLRFAVIKVPTMYPGSQTCSCCGHRNPLVKNLAIRNWECPECHTKHNRDTNASINILNKGLQIQSA